MKKHIARVCTILILLVVVGCASTDEIVIDSTKRSPTASVELFTGGHLPTSQYREVAELSYLGPREDELKAQKFFLARARKIGGNAILFYVVPAGIKGGGTVFQTTAWLFKGKVIVYQ